MKHYALIGKRLGHSWSERWFEEKFAREGRGDCSYRLKEMASLDGLRRWVADGEISGFNVTTPYKQAIVPLLDNLSPTAQIVGAVNCVMVKNGRLTGFNTDVPAFEHTLEDYLKGHDEQHERAVVMGSGGAAKAVSFALDVLGIYHILLSRSGEEPPQGEMRLATGEIYGYSRTMVEAFRPTMVINATPVGMWPDVDSTPWPWPELLGSDMLVYDLVYNPSPTLLLQQAAAAGASTMDGLAMLHRQAELSWRLWQWQ